MSVFSTFDIAGSALSAQSLRLNLTASNLANMHDVAGNAADVYRSREAMFRAAGDPFSSALAGVDVLGVVESTAPPIERYDPGNPQANEQGIVYASRSYQSNLEVINTAKDLMLRTLTLGQG